MADPFPEPNSRKYPFPIFLSLSLLIFAPIRAFLAKSHRWFLELRYPIPGRSSKPTYPRNPSAG